MEVLFETFTWSPLHLLVPFVIIQRIVELRVSRRNTVWLRSRGAIEVGAEHYPTIVAVHVLWFVSMIVECIVLTRVVSEFWIPLLVLFLLAQVLRYWTIATLGRRWSTRVLVLPKAKRITTGPFAFVRHPNYIAVMIELATLPLMLGAFITAVAISIVNAIVLRRRIMVEEQAL